MRMKRFLGGPAWRGQEGAVTFFGIVMAVILVITAIILIMLIRAVMVPEQVTVTIQIKNDEGFPLPGTAILLDGQRTGYADSNGIYAYVYPANKRGESRLIRAEIVDFDPARIKARFIGYSHHGYPDPSTDIRDADRYYHRQPNQRPA